jgi:hypothetical protein
LPISQLFVDQVVDFPLKSARAQLCARSACIVAGITEIHVKHLSGPLSIM